MQIYTQNPNHARKNMKFFESTSQQVNESTSFGSAWVCFRVCFRVCEKKYTYFIH